MQRVRISSQRSPLHKLGDSHLSLSPKFRVATLKSSLLDLSLESELSLKGQPLIPGLPDDVALTCLLRLPVQTHTACRAVCRRWHMLLGTQERFFGLRRQLGFHDPWLYVAAYNKLTEKLQWLVLDVGRGYWHTVPVMPCKVSPHGFRCVSVPDEGTLYVCGGVLSGADSPLDVVLRFDVCRNRWTVMSPMSTPRSFFGTGMIDGKIYAAGGNSFDLFELDSVEVMDTISGRWRPVSRMGMNMASYDANVLNGKLFVTEGWLWPFFVSPRGQVYDPRRDQWEDMPAGLREGWTGFSAVVYGHLIVVSEHERMKVKVYDMKSDSWEAVGGQGLPEVISKPFTVGSCGDRIYVVGKNVHVAVGRFFRFRDDRDVKKLRFGVRWTVVDGPESFSDLMPSNSQILFA